VVIGATGDVLVTETLAWSLFFGILAVLPWVVGRACHFVLGGDASALWEGALIARARRSPEFRKFCGSGTLLIVAGIVLFRLDAQHREAVQEQQYEQQLQAEAREASERAAAKRQREAAELQRQTAAREAAQRAAAIAAQREAAERKAAAEREAGEREAAAERAATISATDLLVSNNSSA